MSLSAIRMEMHLLEREISILQILEHPNIVKLYGVFQDEDNIYLSMELCEGGSLKEQIVHGPLPEEAVRQVANQTLQALTYLHKKNVCHRDLKPENILFTSSGVVKLGDFGLARVMEGTKDFSRVGTPYYLAPEVILGRYNKRCDLWSLGVVLYYALLGSLPFKGEDFEELFSSIQNGIVRNWHGCSPAAKDFLQQLLEPRLNRRFSAMDALRHPWLN
mmetsp:Transcript_5350/g.9820  ORF Transcript_5350/g.9820 Transcript_5350/m.9820 type:complete len:218 (+) Transcript_5350:1063-1716(+)